MTRCATPQPGVDRMVSTSWSGRRWSSPAARQGRGLARGFEGRLPLQHHHVSDQNSSSSRCRASFSLALKHGIYRDQIATTFLFGNDFAGTAHFGKKITQFRKPVAHGKHRLCVVDMKLRPKREIRDGRREYVYQSESRMSRHHVSAAGSAELAMALFGLVVSADLISSLCHLHV